MSEHSLHVESDFTEVDTRTLDDRTRLTLGELLQGAKRVKLYTNPRGDVLLRPVVDVPLSEAWLYKNKSALQSVRRGLEDARAGRVRRIKLR